MLFETWKGSGFCVITCTEVVWTVCQPSGCVYTTQCSTCGSERITQRETATVGAVR